MTREEALAILGKDASEDQINALIESVKTASAAAVELETKGLKDNKTKLLGQMAKLKENQMPEGFDAEGYASFTTEKDEFDKKKKELDDLELEGKGQWEALKLQLNTTHSTALQKVMDDTSGEIAGLKKALDKELIENAAIKAIETEKGNSLFLLPHMRGNIETVKAEDGTYSVRVLDKEGNARMNDDQTKPFSVADLVAEMKSNDSFAPAFPQQNGGGGGNPNPGGGGSTGINPWKSDSKNITEQARITKENPTLATQMKKAAGVSA